MHVFNLFVPVLVKSGVWRTPILQQGGSVVVIERRGLSHEYQLHHGNIMSDPVFVHNSLTRVKVELFGEQPLAA